MNEARKAGLLRIRRGHSPNCSATGSFIGTAIASAAVGAAVINAYADRFRAFLDRSEPPIDPGSIRPGDGPKSPKQRKESDGPLFRHESFGGIVHWPMPPAQLHVGHAVVEAVINAGARVLPVRVAPAGALSAPTEMHISLTNRCPVRCDGCYLDAGPDGEHANIAALKADLADAAAAGVFEVAIGGGEVAVTPDLVEVCRFIRELGMVPNLTTSGIGLTPELIRLLAPFVGQINVSWDGPTAVYRRVRGWNGSDLAVAALLHLREAGVRVGVNTVLVQANIEHLDQMAHTLSRSGVSEWQWLRFKPSGRGADTYPSFALSPKENARLWPAAIRIELAYNLDIRFDCAMVPFLVMHDPDPERVRLLGVNGCSGGSELLTRSSEGRFQPCSFANWTGARRPQRPEPLDDGSATRISEVEVPDAASDLSIAWDTDDSLLAWRRRAASPPEPCGSCDWATVCRGGCRVVSHHLTGDAMAPDPECPRVREWVGD